MKLILIGGKSGSGKNLVGQIMSEYFKEKGLSVMTLGNADSVKAYALKYFNLVNYKTEEGRKIMMGLSEMMYDLVPNYWERQTLSHIHLMEDKYDKDFDVVIITDWRYPMTFEFFHDLFEVSTLYIKRENPNTYSDEIQKNRAEQEETLKSYIDHTIYNSGTLEELKQKVINYLEGK